MFEKKSISEIKDWSHIDYVCIKAKSGDLLSDDFNIAWADYKLLLKEKASKNNKCLKCKYLMMCSPCIVVNYLSTGDYNTPAETVCQLTHLRVNMCNSID